MTSSHRTTSLLALAATVTLVLAAGPAASADVFAIDADHPLASDRKIAVYEETGVVSANLTRVDIGLTIAEESGDAGIDGYYVDSNKRYVCLDYREAIPRTLRVYYPAAYFEPRVAKLDSLTSEHVARLEPTANRTYTALKVTFQGEARACFPVGLEAGVTVGLKSWANEKFESWTGWSLPSVQGGDRQWRYLPAGAFANRTYRIPANQSDLTVQYARPSDGQEQWLSVPSCSDPTEQRVCRYDSERSNRTILLSTAEDPPSVRWKPGDDLREDFSSAVTDLGAAVDRAMRFVGGLFGGNGGESRG